MATSDGSADSGGMGSSGESSYNVELYVYDMKKELADTLAGVSWDQSQPLWHTGVVAYGREYFFGSSGIESCTPGSTILGEPRRIDELGESQVPYQLFLEYIFGLAESSYKPGSYDVLKKNCNTFTEEVSQFLCGRGISKELFLETENIERNLLVDKLGPILTRLKLRDNESKGIHFGNGLQSSASYVPRDVRRLSDEKEFDELNSAIEEVRNQSLLLEDRRNTLNQKLLKREKKEKRKKEKKKKKKETPEEKQERRKRRHSRAAVTFDLQEVKEKGARRNSEPALSPTVQPPTLLFHSPSGQDITSIEIQSPPVCSESPVVEPVAPSEQSPPPTAGETFTSTNISDPQEIDEAPTMSSNQEPPPPEEIPSSEEPQPLEEPPQAGGSSTGAEASPMPEIEREPPIVFKDVVDTRADFDGFVSSCAEMLSGEEQRHMEELRSYVIDDEGSWALGETFNIFFTRVFHDPNIPDSARFHLLRIMSAAALKDDVILMLHQDRKEHTIMNYANKIESLTPDIQEALALFFVNMFEHLSPSEWLLYISEWEENGQHISNIRVTTKIAVNALLHANSKVQDYGTALMYNLGTKEVKTVVFDDVAPELAMAILQFFNNNPNEEYTFRTISALAKFATASNEVPMLIKMIGPEPGAFSGMSERIDAIISRLQERLNKAGF